MKADILSFCVVLFTALSTAVFAEDIKDIKPPVYFPSNYFILIVIAGIVILAAVIFLVLFLVKRNKQAKSEVSFTILKPAHQIAYEAMNILKRRNLPQLGRIKEYYIRLSDIIRHYIESRFNIRASEMTTEEFLLNLRDSSDLNGSQKNLLKQFLNRCDLVKFAMYGPAQYEIDDSFSAAKKLVDETGFWEEESKNGVK